LIIIGGVIKKSLWRIILLSLALALVALAVVNRVGPTYQVHFSYLISLSEREMAQEFRFDGFYALQATDLFAATLSEWVQTPEVIVDAYRESGLVLPDRDPKWLTRVVRAEKAAPQLVTVVISHSDAEAAMLLSDGLRRVMERNVARYHDEGIPAVTFRVVATEPWSGVQERSGGVISGATFVFSFLFLINGVLLWESLRKME